MPWATEGENLDQWGFRPGGPAWPPKAISFAPSSIAEFSLDRRPGNVPRAIRLIQAAR